MRSVDGQCPKNKSGCKWHLFYYNRFATFRKVLDPEMKDATKCGIAQKCKMDSREEITEDEEGILWEKGLLGGHSAESLMYTMYFYNGKLFGLRACEHRLLRFCNICVKENMIIFDESLSKTCLLYTSPSPRDA